MLKYVGILSLQCFVACDLFLIALSPMNCFVSSKEFKTEMEGSGNPSD